MALTPEQAIDAVGEVFGRHPGYRALHAKGVVLTGTFTALAGATALSRALHLNREPVPVTVRFSNGGGDPSHPDGAPDPRGLAIKFYLPDDSRTDIVAVSSPLFPVRTPEAFIELVKAQSGPSAAWKLPVFLARHPEAIRVLPVVAPTLRAPVSYATIPYYALHAYKWINSSDAEHFVRYTLRPHAAVARLKPWEARRRLDAGTLEIDGVDSERERGDDVLVFDPTRVADGIACSDDPILRFRPHAYSESIRRRTGGS